MNEDLINQIVRRILSEPTFQALLHGNTAGNQENRVAKPNGLALLNYVSELDRVLAAVRRSYGADYTLSILPSDQTFVAKPNLPEGMTWITPEDALGKSDWQTIILPTCSPNTLAKAALGIRDNPISEILGRAISQGIPTMISSEYLGFTARTPKAYYELYEGYLKTVQSYGVKVCATIGDNGTSFHVEQRSANCDRQNTSNKLSALIREEIQYDKKFLGDKQVYGFTEGSRVLVKQGTVISPLARDTLKMRRIELCYEMEEGRR
jgi:hypothetical protein